MGHVDADLVGSAGFEHAADQAGHGRLSEAFQHLVMGDRLTGVGAPGDGHFLPVGGAPVDCRRDASGAALGHTPDEGEVAPLQPPVPPMGGELFRQAVVRAVILGHDQKPAGILVDPVHDAGALYPANAGQAFATMGDQGIHQGARFISGTGMDHEAGGLVDDDHVLVLVDDAKVHGLGQGLRRGGLRKDNVQQISRFHLVLRFAHRDTLDRHRAIRNKGLKPRPADIGEGKRQRLVQPVGCGCLGLEGV